MTVETNTTLELKDIKAIEFERNGRQGWAGWDRGTNRNRLR